VNSLLSSWGGELRFVTNRISVISFEQTSTICNIFKLCFSCYFEGYKTYNN
jgi:hypothetical protein